MVVAVKNVAVRTMLSCTALLTATSPASADAGATAQSIANSIFKGEAVSDFERVPTDFEAGELLDLVGCRPELGKGSTQTLVALIYRCEGSKEGRPIERSLELLFDGGILKSAWLDVDKATFAPTQHALDMEQIPSKAKVERAFLKAVKEGADISLGGLIPLPSEKRKQRFVSLAGCEAQSISERKDSDRRIIYVCEGAPPNTSSLVTLSFDDAGRPTGLALSTLSVSKRTVHTTVPVSR